VSVLFPFFGMSFREHLSTLSQVIEELPLLFLRLPAHFGV